MPQGSSELPIELPVANQRRDNRDSDYVFTDHFLTLGDRLRSRLPKSKPKKFILSIFYRMLRSVAKRMDKFFPHRIQVKKPTENELLDMACFLQNDIDILSNKYGVNYSNK